MDILKSLPMLASVLGDQYDVNVRIGGKDAKTDGKTIFLPALPLDSDAETLAKVRGFLDHEAAHIRHTDFQAIKNAGMNPITFTFFNAIEDWRIERRLAEIYPGCGQNLRWLIKHIFLDKQDKGAERAGAKSPALSVLDYVLLTVRAWEVTELSERVENLKTDIENHFPQLLSEIDKIMAQVKRHCPDSATAILYAHQLTDCLKNWKDSASQNRSRQHENQKQEDSNKTPPTSQPNEEKNKEEDGCNSQSDTQKTGSERCDNSEELPGNGDNAASSIAKPEPDSDAKAEIDSLFTMQAEDLPQGLGELLGSSLSKLVSTQADSDDAFRMAVKVSKIPDELEDSEISDAMTASIALRARLSGLLQSQVQRKICPSRHGKLYPGSLYRLRLGNPKVFRRESEHKGLNTAVHILLDASGSMIGSPIRLALCSCYAIAKALENQKGISVGITSFPAYTYNTIGVYSLLPQGGRLTRRMKIPARGETPLGASLYWVMSELYKRTEERKILLILTDGYPSDWNLTERALEETAVFGIEAYGIGLLNDSIKTFLPEKSRVISEMNDLAPAILGLLGQTLTGRVVL